MKINPSLTCLLVCMLVACSKAPEISQKSDETPVTIPESLYATVNFPVGVAVPADPFPNSILQSPQRQELVTRYFNSITAENIMKMQYLHPSPEVYNFEHADALTDFAVQNQIIVHGHALVWHTQAPDWMNQLTGNREKFIAVLQDHVRTVAKHFSGRLESWDVVNEAFSDDRESVYRDTIWYENIGKEYLEIAFRTAREADPSADLYYNDYSISGGNDQHKLAKVLAMLDDFEERNVPIDGVGFQVHIDTDYPSMADMKWAFSQVVKRGLKVRISELDISVNQTEDYQTLTDEVANRQSLRYQQVAQAYLESVPESLRGGITVWGLTDEDSWIPGFRNRPDWPLLFNADFTGKPALEGLRQGLGLAAQQQPLTRFDWFEYQGKDPVFEAPLSEDEYQNPVLAGFYPDPSIVRKDDDYYMVTSSFAYTPGLPVLHSRDLVNWSLIGYGLTRESQVNMNGNRVSRGIFAPTIRYHDGLFYIITTAVDSGGNFLITAENPAGPWSDPVWLPEIDGIDPDIFFDDDGKVYITHNGPPVGEPLYDGHRAIWMWEYDLKAEKVVADSARLLINGGTELSKQPIWIEAPHLYKINDWYYLLCAEGGTADNHSEVVFRSRDLADTFEPYDRNPILTQRDLDPSRTDPVTTAGHADLVQTPDGKWWAVFLATRAYNQRFYNSGRETFLLPVSWQQEWPVILQQGKSLPFRLVKPALPSAPQPDEPLTGNFVWRDEFTGSRIAKQWNQLRSYDTDGLRQTDDALWMKPSSQRLTEAGRPAFIARRQQHMHYTASAQISMPEDNNVSAGLVAFQNENFHYYLGVTYAENKAEIFIERTREGLSEIIQRTRIPAKNDTPVILTITGDKGKIGFSYALNGQSQSLLTDADGTLLSTQVAGGFVGTMLGLHSRMEVSQ